MGWIWLPEKTQDGVAIAGVGTCGCQGFSYCSEEAWPLCLRQSFEAIRCTKCDMPVVWRRRESVSKYELKDGAGWDMDAIGRQSA